jgi:hypothetical protein
MTLLAGWQNFFVIVGSSAGALTGLQFVVVVLIADLPITRGTAEANDAYATPTIVHFGTVLLMSAVLSAPWRGIAAPAALWGTAGIAGVVYSVVVARRLRSQTAYEPVFEDWLFHVLLPVVAYTVLAAAAWVSRAHAREALFGVGGAALLLLVIGLHNAWDTVTYLVFVRNEEQRRDADGPR